jgi:Paraquat-inducible protein A
MLPEVSAGDPQHAGASHARGSLRVTSTRWLVLALIVVSLILLIPGLFLPVLTIRGVLTRDGIAQVAPMMLQRGLNEDTLNALKAMMNPTVVGLLEATGGDLRQMIIDRVTPSLTASLLQNVGDVEVFQQTRSIVGSVRRLYEVGSPVPATLILLFSVVVPFVKMALVGWATFAADATRRRRMLAFVETIAKWSMADVFVVALFITYLAAMASQNAPGSGPPVVAFTAQFGAGFYWFAAYCVFSLASQQLTARVLAARV